MVPNINPRGRSFRGVTMYVMHDKGAQTSQRVGNTSTHNLHTQDIVMASRYMAWTDQNREFLKQENGGSSCGAKATAGNVYHQTISWKPGETPSWEHMEETAKELIERQGLSEHQYFLVEHTDEPHKHVHIVVGLTNPETGKIHNVYRDRKVADRWANEYEAKHEVVCENRAKKYKDWEQQIEEKKEKLEAFGKKTRKEEYKQVVSECFASSDSGKAFVAAMESHGLTLARGNRRSHVVVDQGGEIYALNRLVELEDGSTGRAIGKIMNVRLKGVDREALPVADDLAAQRKSFDRDQAEVEQQSRMLEAADVAAETEQDPAEKAVQEKPDWRHRAEPEEVKKARVQKEKRAREQAERERQARKLWFEKRQSEKVQESREKWQIDALTKERDDSYENLKSLSGFWAKHVFKRRQHREAVDQYLDNESRLQERTVRFRSDVEALNKKRPDWAIKKELEKAEIGPNLTVPERDSEVRQWQMRQRFNERMANDNRECAESQELSVEREQPSEIEQKIITREEAFEEHLRKSREEDRDQGMER